MSQYFSFYLSKKNSNGVFEFVGPYVKKKNEFIPKPLLVRSRSFIDSDKFKDLSNGNVALNKLDETLKPLCENTGWSGEESYSTAWAIPYRDMLSEVASGGIYRGYVNSTEFTYLKSHNFETEYHYDVDLIPAEIIAEQGKGDYVSVAYTATCESSYHAKLLIEMVEELIPWDEDKDDFYFIFETEY